MGRMDQRPYAHHRLACLTQRSKINVFAIASVKVLDNQIFYGTLSI
jgi:hypothetical protein